MTIRPNLDNLDEWGRPGTGKRVSFYATTGEVQTWLREYLLPQYAPYRLLAHRSVQVSGGDYIWQLGVYDIDDFVKIMQLPVRLLNFWIWSESIDPDLPMDADISLLQRLWTLKGMILLQHGSRQDSSSIVRVGRNRHLPTGATVVNEEYQDVFQYLCRCIRSHLIYSSLRSCYDGREYEDLDERMTEGAVKAYPEGLPAVIRPGRFLGD